MNAQNLILGFDLEIHLVMANNGTGIPGGHRLPISIDFDAAYNISQNFSLQSKIGRTFHLEFLGWK